MLTSSFRRASAAQQLCRRGLKGAFNVGGATAVPEGDDPSVAHDGLAPPDDCA